MPPIKRKLPPKEGDTVRLRLEVQRERLTPDANTAKIQTFIDDTGGVRLDKYLADFRYWNIADLAIVKRASK